MRRSSLSIAVITLSTALLVSSCTVRTGVHASYQGPAVVEFVELRPGVWVAIDYPWPLFYSHGYYWVYRDGQWLRSYTYYGGSWIIVHHYYVPGVLHRLDRPPRYYVRYRPPPERPRYVAPRVRDHRTPAERAPQPRVRDHRDPPARDHRAPPPRVRDHREPPPREQAPRERDQRPREREDAPRVRDHRDRPE
jgi:hypothetical protein